MKDIGKEILEISQFRQKYGELLKLSVQNEFGCLSESSINSDQGIDWRYLLSVASILATSNIEECQAAALRISSACIQSINTTPEMKSAATVVLSELTNTPAINLALRKGYIDKESLNKLPAPLLLEKIRRDFKYTIVNESGSLIWLNKFQEELLTKSMNLDIVSASAPTSAGKSFALLILLRRLLQTENIKIAYLVPTRALIAQVEAEILSLVKESDTKGIYVSSVPKVPKNWAQVKQIYIFTQERLKWMIDENTNFYLDWLIVDEAQKVGDGYRGLILQQSLMSAEARNDNLKLVYTSPLIQNPEYLLKDHKGRQQKDKIQTDIVTVNQNLIWVDQVPGKLKNWNINLITDQGKENLGSFHLEQKPYKDSDRLPLVVNALHTQGSSIIYANIPSDAEKVAQKIFNLLPEVKKIDTDLKGLIKLSKQVIHRKFILCDILKKGIAVHYGNMPTIIRLEIERLFKLGKIKYLVCTSTLLEGVNLPARSIFLRRPRRGRSNPMDEVDFWNLAGRAGRLGKDFQGNIICIDVSKKNVWDFEPPAKRGRFSVKNASEINAEKINDLISFANAKTPRSDALKEPFLEYALGFFIQEYLRDGKIKIRGIEDEQLIQKLQVAVATVIQESEIPEDIMIRNPGISPYAQRALLDYFSTHKNFARLIPCSPKKTNAVDDYYVPLITRVFKYLSGEHLSRVFPMALLVVNWTGGAPLAAIIGKNIRYWRKKKPDKKVATIIRDTMSDIEDFARFKFSKYSSCYLDLLRHFLKSRGEDELLQSIPNLHMWLEFGASEETQLSLLTLGFSRTAAIQISEIIGQENFTLDKCIDWVRNFHFANTNLAETIQEEIKLIQDSISLRES